ncbi:MAG: hypothetical protein KAV00_08410, partial [Phycisphaerae bacterium]|nr:hypothetical protein [Phycisphaerae bacterium]
MQRKTIAGGIGSTLPLLKLVTGVVLVTGLVKIGPAQTTKSDKGNWIAPAPIPGRPQKTGIKLAMRTRPVMDADVTPLKLSAASVNIVWSTDRKYFYTLERGGLLRRINVETLIEQRRLTIAKRCTRMAMSKAGLVVVVPSAKQVWLIHPETLVVRRKIKVPKALRAVIVNPGTTTAFYRTDSSNLFVLNLTRGSTGPTLKWAVDPKLRQVLWRNGGLINQDVEHTALSKDGRTIYARSDRYLIRLRVDSGKVTVVEKGYRLDAQIAGLLLSEDGKRLVMIGWGLVEQESGVTSPAPTIIFSTGDLETPLAKFHCGRVLAWWVGGKRMFRCGLSSSHTNDVAMLDEKGRHLKTYILPAIGRRYDYSRTPRQFLIEPNGRGLIVQTSKGTYRIRFTDRLKNPPQPRTEKASLLG